MINFNYETDFFIEDEKIYHDWLFRITASEDVILGDLSFIFCSDSYLLNINQTYLDHNTFTDIITFDYSEGRTISGDVFISIDRVKDNAEEFNVEFIIELQRVMAHGVLHLCGYTDKNEDDVVIMRNKEEEKIKMFHVEQ